MARDYDFWVYIVTTATILFSTSALLTPGRAEFWSIAKKSAQLSPRYLSMQQADLLRTLFGRGRSVRSRNTVKEMVSS